MDAMGSIGQYGLNLAIPSSQYLPKPSISANNPHIYCMNRRRFIQMLGAAFSLPAAPAMPLSTASAAIPSAATVPAQARFWAIYTSALHGQCTPQTLQNMLNISQVDAKRYISQLIGDGVIKPNPILQKTVSNVLTRNDDGALQSIKKRMDMKQQAKVGSGAGEVEVSDTREAQDEEMKPEADFTDEICDINMENELEETETQSVEGPETQSKAEVQ